jgi:hypothetical protein
VEIIGHFYLDRNGEAAIPYPGLGAFQIYILKLDPLSKADAV